MNPYKKLRSWWAYNRPCYCALCSSIYSRKNMKVEKSTIGYWVFVCIPCWEDVFTPFTAENEDE